MDYQSDKLACWALIIQKLNLDAFIQDFCINKPKPFLFKFNFKVGLEPLILELNIKIIDFKLMIGDVLNREISIKY